MKKDILIVPVIIIIVWEGIVHVHGIDSFFFPGPIETIIEGIRLCIEKKIYKDILITILRIGITFSIAATIGVPCGLMLGYSKKIYQKFESCIDFFRSIPPTAMFPLFLLMFGVGDLSKIAVVAFSCSFIIAFNTAHGVMNIKATRITAAKFMGASKKQILRHIIFWESLPQTLIGMRTALNISLIMIIVTEMFIGTYAGIGRQIIDNQYVYNIKGLYALILIAGVVGYCFNAIFIFIEKKVVHWVEN